MPRLQAVQLGGKTRVHPHSMQNADGFGFPETPNMEEPISSHVGTNNSTLSVFAQCTNPGVQGQEQASMPWPSEFPNLFGRSWSNIEDKKDGGKVKQGK